jgi:hypothetical protein
MQTESSLGAAIVLIFIDMEDLLAGAGQSSSSRSVRDDPRRSRRRIELTGQVKNSADPFLISEHPIWCHSKIP